MADDDVHVTDLSNIITADNAADNQRFSHEDKEPEARRDYRTDGRKTFYTADFKAQRAAIRNNPAFIKALERFWKMFSPDYSVPSEHELTRHEFIQVEVKVCKALFDPADFTVEEATRAVEEDWKAAAEENRSAEAYTMNHREFLDNMYELVDIWTNSVEASDYVDFANKLFSRITVKVKAGASFKYKWRDLKDIVPIDSDEPSDEFDMEYVAEDIAVVGSSLPVLSLPVDAIRPARRRETMHRQKRATMVRAKRATLAMTRTGHPITPIVARIPVARMLSVAEDDEDDDDDDDDEEAVDTEDMETSQYQKQQKKEQEHLAINTGPDDARNGPTTGIHDVSLPSITTEIQEDGADAQEASNRNEAADKKSSNTNLSDGITEGADVDTIDSTAEAESPILNYTTKVVSFADTGSSANKAQQLISPTTKPVAAASSARRRNRKVSAETTDSEPFVLSFGQATWSSHTQPTAELASKPQWTPNTPFMGTATQDQVNSSQNYHTTITRGAERGGGMWASDSVSAKSRIDSVSNTFTNGTESLVGLGTTGNDHHDSQTRAGARVFHKIHANRKSEKDVSRPISTPESDPESNSTRCSDSNRAVHDILGNSLSRDFRAAKRMEEVVSLGPVQRHNQRFGLPFAQAKRLQLGAFGTFDADKLQGQGLYLGREKFAPYLSGTKADLANVWIKGKEQITLSGEHDSMSKKRREIESLHKPLPVAAPPTPLYRSHKKAWKRGRLVLRNSSQQHSIPINVNSSNEYGKPTENFAWHKQHLRQKQQPLGRGWSSVPTTSVRQHRTARLSDVANQTRKAATTSSVMRQRLLTPTTRQPKIPPRRTPAAPTVRSRGRWF